MNIESKALVSVSDLNEGFSKAARLVDQYGSAIVVVDNVPRYVISDFSRLEEDEVAPIEDVIAASEKFLERNKKVYEELAK